MCEYGCHMLRTLRVCLRNVVLVSMVTSVIKTCIKQGECIMRVLVSSSLNRNIPSYTPKNTIIWMAPYRQLVSNAGIDCEVFGGVAVCGCCLL